MELICCQPFYVCYVTPSTLVFLHWFVARSGYKTVFSMGGRCFLKTHFKSQHDVAKWTGTFWKLQKTFVRASIFRRRACSVEPNAQVKTENVKVTEMSD